MAVQWLADGSGPGHAPKILMCTILPSPLISFDLHSHEFRRLWLQARMFNLKHSEGQSVQSWYELSFRSPPI